MTIPEALVAMTGIICATFLLWKVGGALKDL